MAKTFTIFLEKCKEIATAQEVRAPDRLLLLFAYVSADVYKYIEDCETYADAIEKLKSIYIKTPNVIFAIHKVATRKQQSRETLEEIFYSFLSKDCDLQSVTPLAYRNELVQDAFVNGISSHSIRQRLHKNNRLTVNQAFDKACFLRTAQEHSEAYFHPADTGTVVSPSSETTSFSNQANAEFAFNPTICSKICAFCGFSFHNRKQYPAKEATCYTCGKKGHFAKICSAKLSQKI